MPLGAADQSPGADDEKPVMSFAVYGLRKSYGGVEVLKGVDLAVADGEIHALLGANGAGKSTLIKCLSGAIAPDSGTIVIGNQRHLALSPKTSRQSGVAVIYQDLSLALSLNVVDNIFLGQELRVGPFIRRVAQRSEAKRWLAELGAGIDPGAKLARLSNAELQIVEITKALRSQPQVLILDEPTAALSEREAETLGRYLLALKNRNLPILYVTHRLGEVFTLADHVTVLRGGEVALTGRIADLRQDNLVDAIVGRSVRSDRVLMPRAADQAKVPALEVTNLIASGIGPISFRLRAGEIVGVFGLVGSGRTELLEALFGANRRMGGRMAVRGEVIWARDPAASVAAGIALVPSDRLRKSILGSLSAGENALLPNFAVLGRFGLRRRQHERRVFDRVMGRLDLRPRRYELEVRRFSGGNQQKIVLGRWLSEARCCRLLMLDEPTQGVDVGARRDIYDAIRAVAADSEGRAVLVTSSEPEELMQLAHRVLVLSGGKIAALLEGDEITEEHMISFAHQIEKSRAETS